MTTRVAIVLAVLAASGGVLVGDAIGSVVIRNIPPTSHRVPEGTSLQDIARGIEAAAAERNWYGSRKAPGSIVVSTTIRSHRATVEIGFDEANFWINYRDSSNLDYMTKDQVRRRYEQAISYDDLIGRRKAGRKKEIIKKGPRIHGNYNVWVQQLANHIAARTKTLVAKDVKQEPQPGPLSIADELEKLDGLRIRGVLTQGEFDKLKAKLLAQ